LAELLDISERAVHKRAKSGGWPRIYRRVNGGPSHVYMVSGLPDEVRTVLTGRLGVALAGPAAQAGYTRGKALAAEAAAADEARRLAKEAGLAAYERLPKERQAEADARREILRARDAFLQATDLPKKQGTLLFIREHKAGAIQLADWVQQACGALSWASLYRWERAFTESGLAGLANGYCATRESCIPEHMRDFIKGLLCERPHLGISAVRQAIEARFDGQQIPSTSALRRYVTRWRSENKSLLLYCTHFDKWRDLRMLAMGDASETVTRLNQVWEFDSTPGDVMLKDGRHCLIGVIDVYSRRAKLHVTPTSRATAVAAVTRRALLDWGVPEVAKTDNGSDYVSAHMVRVFESLEIEQLLCRPFHPEDKPHIERFFKTLLHGLFEFLSGYIGHSVAERKAIEDRRSFAQRIMRQGEDPVDIAMTAEELQRICDRWCDAVYHQNVHGSLNGKTPAQMAREWRLPVRRIGDERALDILLSEAPDKEGTRVIGKEGIQVDRGTFIAAELGPHVGKTVFVLLDALDYGSIYVFLINADGSKEFLCRAVDPARTGHDRAEIAAHGKAVQDRVMREGRKELKRLAKEAELTSIDEEILCYRERQRANIHEFPGRSETYTTPAMQEAARAVENVRRVELGPCPIAISTEEETAAAELIDMAQARRDSRPLPATAQEKYEQIGEDLRRGMDVSDADLAWMKRYELWLETGERMAQ
jgi:transposase InsO family protein